MKSYIKFYSILVALLISYLCISILNTNKLSYINLNTLLSEEYQKEKLEEINYTTALNGFGEENGVVTSYTNDPQYRIFFESPKKITSIAFEIDDLSIINTSMQIFGFIDDNLISITESDLKNGKNIVYIAENNSVYDCIRIDFVAEENVTFKFNPDELILNSGIPYIGNFVLWMIIFSAIICSLVNLLEYLVRKLLNKLENLYENKIASGVNKGLFISVSNFILGLKSLNTEVKDFILGFLRFIKENKYILYSAFAIFLACFMFEATNITFSIDEIGEIRRENNLIWVSEGRYGIYLFKAIFSLNNKYSMAIAPLCADVLLVFTGVVLSYMVYTLTENKASKISYVIIIAIFASFPYVNAGYLAFSMYSVPVTLGFLCTIIGVTYTAFGYKSYAITIIPMIIALSMYQAFIAVYATTTVLALILIVQQNKENRIDNTIKEIFKFLIILVFAVILNLVISNIMIEVTGVAKSAYITGLFKGESYSLENTKSIIEAAVSACFLLDNKVYSTILFLLYIVFVIKIVFRKNNNAVKKALLLFYAISFIIMPWLLIIVLNTKLPDRTLLAAPVLAAGMWFLVINNITISKFYKAVIITIAFFAINNQILIMNNLFFIEEIRYQRDLATADQLMEDIMKANNGYVDKPINLIGVPNYENLMYYFYNAPYYETGSIIGLTPLSSYVKRFDEFFNSIGYKVSITPYRGDEKFEGIPVWPAQGSIFVKDDTIFIKYAELE